jgi:hypothetical protein
MLPTQVRNDSPEWKKRARGWIQCDESYAIFAMIIYTTVTAAFILLSISASRLGL